MKAIELTNKYDKNSVLIMVNTITHIQDGNWCTISLVSGDIVEVTEEYIDVKRRLLLMLNI